MQKSLRTSGLGLTNHFRCFANSMLSNELPTPYSYEHDAVRLPTGWQNRNTLFFIDVMQTTSNTTAATTSLFEFQLLLDRNIIIMQQSLHYLQKIWIRLFAPTLHNRKTLSKIYENKWQLLHSTQSRSTSRISSLKHPLESGIRFNSNLLR